MVPQSPRPMRFNVRICRCINQMSSTCHSRCWRYRVDIVRWAIEPLCHTCDANMHVLSQGIDSFKLLAYNIAKQHQDVIMFIVGLDLLITDYVYRISILIT